MPTESATVESVPRLVLFARQFEAAEKYALAMRVGYVNQTERQLLEDLLRHAKGGQVAVEKLRTLNG